MAFRDGSFDIAVAMFTATVVPDARRLLREMRRVVRPGGDLLFVNHFAAEDGPALVGGADPGAAVARARLAPGFRARRPAGAPEGGGRDRGLPALRAVHPGAGAEPDAASPGAGRDGARPIRRSRPRSAEDEADQQLEVRAPRSAPPRPSPARPASAAPRARRAAPGRRRTSSAGSPRRAAAATGSPATGSATAQCRWRRTSRSPPPPARSRSAASPAAAAPAAGGSAGSPPSPPARRASR